MTDLERMAREAGLPIAWISETGVLKWPELARFADLIRADERERCAKIAEQWGLARQPEFGGTALMSCAAAIRAN